MSNTRSAWLNRSGVRQYNTDDINTGHCQEANDIIDGFAECFKYISRGMKTCISEENVQNLYTLLRDIDYLCLRKVSNHDSRIANLR